MTFCRILPAFLLAFFCLALPSIVSAQEDLARGELPSRIGGPSCTNSPRGGGSSLQGSLNVQGLSASEKPPTFTVIVYASGMVIQRAKVRNGGSFSFNCIPNESVTLAAEINGVEISSNSVGLMLAPPSMNRHDLFVNWAMAGREIQRRAEVISARNAYERKSANRRLFEKAMDLIDRKKPSEAIKLLTRLLESDPKDFVAWTELGDIHFNSEQYDDAAVAFGKAIELKQDHLSAVVGLGRSRMGLKDLQGAIDVLKAAADAQPDSADLHHYLGEAYLNNRQGSLAIAHMNRSIVLAPDAKAALHLRIAALYHVAGAKHLAANEYKLLLSKLPSYPDKQKLEVYIAENPPEN